MEEDGRGRGWRGVERKDGMSELTMTIMCPLVDDKENTTSAHNFVHLYSYTKDTIIWNKKVTNENQHQEKKLFPPNLLFRRFRDDDCSCSSLYSSQSAPSALS